MKRKVGRRKAGPKRLFLLLQILPMRPYVTRLMADLRSCRVRQNRLMRMMAKMPAQNNLPYEDRRRRHDAEAELSTLRLQEQTLLREFRKLGIRVGNVVRGEMLFACLVDQRDAYFVWYDGDKRPSHWRFRGEAELHPIPERWFSLFANEAGRKKVEDRIV